MAAAFALQALEHGMVGIAMSNAQALVAPWGGQDRLFGTNPISIAIPSGEQAPIVIDTSTSAISGGRVTVARHDGAKLGGPWVVDTQGRMTADPSDFAAIVPLGPKGFGWLLFVEILAGILSGMGGSRFVQPNPDTEHPSTIGQLFMAIDVARLMPVAEFKAQVDALIGTVKASRPAEGFVEILLPGESAAREYERRQREGIPVRDEYWSQLVATADELGVDLEALRSSG
jgi:L-2-hydroxycarboxylate dehydrogenase (NAD+)